MTNPHHADPLRRCCQWQTLRIFTCLILALGGTASIFAATTTKQNFNIPTGDAVAALKEFSAQSREQILFSTDKMAGIKTNAVKGEMTPGEALEQLLAGTGFSARQDAQTGA